MMNLIPDEIQSLPREVEKNVQKCYLAKVLDKKTFKSQRHSFRNVDCARAMRDIAGRISTKLPPNRGLLSWHLGKQLLIGTLRIFLYMVMHVTAKAEKTLKKVESGKPAGKTESHNLPPESLMFPNEIIDSQRDLHTPPCQDAHQIDECDGCINSNNLQKPHMTHFAFHSFDMLDNGETDISADAFLREGLSDAWIHTAITNTPKRKAGEMGEDDIATFGTPVKHARRNLEAEFSTCDVPRAEGEAGSFQATHENFIQSHFEENEEVVAKDLRDTDLEEVQVHSNTTVPEPDDTTGIILPDTSQPPIPRAEARRNEISPRPATMLEKKMKRRMSNVKTGTVSLEDRLVDGTKYCNSITTLMKISHINWTIDGYTAGGPRLEDRVEVHNFEENEFDTVDLRSLENIIASHEISAALNVETEQIAQQEITQDKDLHVEQEQSPIHESTHHISPQIDMADLPPPIPSPEIRDSWTRVSHDQSSRGKHQRGFLIDVDNATTHLSSDQENTQTYNLLKNHWQIKKNYNDLEVHPPVAFDEFMKPTEVTIKSYTQRLKSCMNAMRANKLRMNQTAPYDTIWLHPLAF